MAKKVFSKARISAAAGVILAGFGLLILAAPQSRIAQTQSGFTSQQNRTLTGGNLVIVRTDLKEQTIQFGDALEVIITLQNRGKEPLTIPPDALVLKNTGWTGFPGLGSGQGESALVRIGFDSKEGFTLQPGESVALKGSNLEMAAKTMGPMKASFVIETANGPLLRELGNPTEFSVAYDVAPSKLLSSAWAAKTTEERQRLQSEFVEILRLDTKDEGWRNRFYVEGTLTFLGCYSLPYLEAAMKDSDLVVKERAVQALSRVAWNAGQLNFFIADLVKKNQGQEWATSVGKCDEDYALRESLRLAIAGLSDKEPRVRVAAISVLTSRAAEEANLRRSQANSQRRPEALDERTRRRYAAIGLVDPAIPLVQKMVSDADSSVRSEAQKFLSNFASQQRVADKVAVSLADSDAGVRRQALQALKRSHELPPMATLEQAFASAKGEIALGLIELLFEREDAGLATKLSPGFKERSVPERLMILTAIAGHTGEAALNLVTLGLKDTEGEVQRTALMRLLEFPTAKATSLMKAHSASLLPEVREFAVAVQKELESRTLFPFLGRAGGSPVESLFPSTNGTQPLVSPDGKWVAYVETGWGRQFPLGGMGRSHLQSLTHVVRSDGTSDHIVSDMFLVGWMSDSRRLASARDGYAAVVNLEGKVVTEFGERLDKPEGRRGFDRETWPPSPTGRRYGAAMPHTKRFRHKGEDSRSIGMFDYGEDAAFSPDGKWFGPRQVNDQWQFVDSQGQTIEVKRPADAPWGYRAVWSPDGTHIVFVPLVMSNSFGGSEEIQLRKAIVINFVGQITEAVLEVDEFPKVGDWDYRKGRWDPWSKDGKQLAFIRQNQVWTADANGGNAKQVTFQAFNKAFPTFSPDGTKIAYVTWQPDSRERHMRFGPTDIWVVACKTGMATRVTQADAGRIQGLSWLDNVTLMYDRMEPAESHSTLRKTSLR
jgi:hypothetical protein